MGYAIGDVIVDGQSVGPVAQYQFTNVAAAHTVFAVAMPIPCLLTDKTVLNVYTFEGQDAADATFQVWNAGAAGNVQYTLADDAAWLACSPESGLSSGEYDTITVSFSTAALAEGAYAATVTAAAPDAQNSPISITVNLLVGAVLYVDADAAGADNGMGWANAFTNLQGALNVAQSGHEIWVAEGVYKPTSGSSRYSYFSMKSGVDVYGGFAGHETEREARSWPTNETILSGDIGVQGNYNDNVYTVIKGAGAALDGVVVELANDDESGSGGGGEGGGLEDRGCAMTVRNCTFRNNRATGYYGCGGGMYLTANTTVDNCRFLNNHAGGLYGVGGGGIYNSGGSPTIRRCVFQNNSVSGFNAYGGGIKNDSSSPLIEFCTFTANSAADGAGIENWRSSAPVIRNCLFYNNTVGSCGGGIDNDAAGLSGNHATVVQCTFYGNDGNAIFSKMDGTATVTNCIVAGGDRIGGSGNTVAYSNVEGGYDGEGNIDEDPLFADAGNDDFHLKSQAGRYDPAGGQFVYTDPVTSPCIDAGDPGDPVGDEPAPNGGRVNMGAYGGTVEASRTFVACALAVQSTPITGIEVTATPPAVGATTDYEINDVPGGVEFTLTAPATASDGSDFYRFVRWLVNEAPQAEGQLSVALTILADATVVAEYEVARKGDFDGDGNIDFWDFMDFIPVYNLNSGDPGWEPNGPFGDFDDDGDVDFWDFMDFIGEYGS